MTTSQLFTFQYVEPGSYLRPTVMVHASEFCAGKLFKAYQQWCADTGHPCEWAVSEDLSALHLGRWYLYSPLDGVLGLQADSMPPTVDFDEDIVKVHPISDWHGVIEVLGPADLALLVKTFEANGHPAACRMDATGRVFTTYDIVMHGPSDAYPEGASFLYTDAHPNIEVMGHRSFTMHVGGDNAHHRVQTLLNQHINAHAIMNNQTDVASFAADDSQTVLTQDSTVNATAHPVHTELEPVIITPADLVPIDKGFQPAAEDAAAGDTTFALPETIPVLDLTINVSSAEDVIEDTCGAPVDDGMEYSSSTAGLDTALAQDAVVESLGGIVVEANADSQTVLSSTGSSMTVVTQSEDVPLVGKHNVDVSRLLNKGVGAEAKPKRPKRAQSDTRFEGNKPRVPQTKPQRPAAPPIPRDGQAAAYAAKLLESQAARTLAELGEDGIDHINVGSSGKTRLGQFLDINSEARFEYPGFGWFKSVGGLWVWLAIDPEKRTDDIRHMSGPRARRAAQDVRQFEVEGFYHMIADAVWHRVCQYPDAMNDLAGNDLPFKQYALSGESGLPFWPTIGKWYLPVLDEIARVIKARRETGDATIAPNFAFLDNLMRAGKSERPSVSEQRANRGRGQSRTGSGGYKYGQRVPA